ncbi:uncharacterized protein LOC131801682 [Musca domestica]|uniref:Uncharacterized protein LOC131801682 n=1 Tax=Musca domestica TaxID=7370 RepID=A0ABM3UST8_MUSDO|nr:uncharacterized protein LOC131801682 [Musca domestica]
MKEMSRNLKKSSSQFKILLKNLDEVNDTHKFPFNGVKDLQAFDELVRQNETILKQFKEFIAKTGGEGPPQFLRAAVRKIFSDNLACQYSWKGTSVKPSAEKCYLVTVIKNISHLKYTSNDKDMNTILQKHFVHAPDRVTKRKRSD